jgi:heme-degrading monooxygenase HmoA
MEISQTPSTPYYAVIFTSIRTEGDNGYDEMSDKMVALAVQQPGYLGHESARNEIGITVSYWRSLDDIKAWKRNIEHMVALRKGREIWYQTYKTRICKVEADYGM